ncbi:TPA: hypothetical protein NHU29_003149 [Raoultella ornithinolytica]|nr:hypothetical protein [Raoultella ornithinolytica]HDV8371041.1 hypothetical protein [Raoultella ornithinolytica]
MANETEFKFGDYAIIEQKRHGVPSEMFVHKVIGIRRSNSWVDVPVQSPATETLHCGMEVVCLCICCGIDETKVRQYRVKDMQRSSRLPDSELTAALATIEKCREIVGSPAGLDLQDHLRLLAAENVGLKSFGDTLFDMYKGLEISGGGIHDEQSVVCQQVALDAAMSAFEEIETPATDRIYAEAEARGVEKAIECIVQTITPNHETILKELAQQLRKGSK